MDWSCQGKEIGTHEAYVNDLEGALEGKTSWWSGSKISGIYWLPNCGQALSRASYKKKRAAA